MENREKCLPEIRYIGLRIAYFRKLKNITQEELAKQVNINKNYLSHIESGSSSKVISLPLLISIARSLEIELSLLVDLSDFKSVNQNISNEFEEMRAMFQEMKQMNAELDRLIAHMDEEGWQ